MATGLGLGWVVEGIKSGEWGSGGKPAGRKMLGGVGKTGGGLDNSTRVGSSRLAGEEKLGGAGKNPGDGSGGSIYPCSHKRGGEDVPLPHSMGPPSGMRRRCEAAPAQCAFSSPPAWNSHGPELPAVQATQGEGGVRPVWPFGGVTCQRCWSGTPPACQPSWSVGPSGSTVLDKNREAVSLNGVPKSCEDCGGMTGGRQDDLGSCPNLVGAADDDEKHGRADGLRDGVKLDVVIPAGSFASCDSSIHDVTPTGSSAECHARGVVRRRCRVKTQDRGEVLRRRVCQNE